MLVIKTYQVALLAATLLWQTRIDARSATAKFCGRQLGEIMSKVCHAYNSPAWDVPTVVEQHGTSRRKRQLGIADECCTLGCSWEQLSNYCSISALSESPLDDLEAHMIADRSAEESSNAASVPAVVGSEAYEPGNGQAARREDLIRNAVRAAPVVGTVSPLLTWGRTLNTDLPPIEQDRYAYVAIYT